jgi:hypothetical protein
MTRSRIWYEARIVRPFIAWDLDESSWHLAGYDANNNVVWFWYNVQTLIVEDGETRLIRYVSVDTDRGRYLVNEQRVSRRLRPYLVAYTHADVWENTYRLPWVLYDYDAVAAAATLEPAIPRRSLVRLTMIVMNDRDVEWTRRPRLHIQLNPPIPSLDRAADWSVALARSGLRWGDQSVYHWIPGHVVPAGDEIVVPPNGRRSEFVYEFETSEDISALGIALDGGEADVRTITGPGQPSSGPFPWTDVQITRIEFAPPVEETRRRVEEYERDWRARIAARRQVTG